MELSPEGVIAYITGYIQSLPSAIARGDVFALTITLIAFFIAVVIINRLTSLLIVVLKKIILFVIVALAFWQFVMMFFARISAEGLTQDTLIFGAAGFIIGFIALGISLFVALRSFHEARKEHAPGKEKGPQPSPAPELPLKAPADKTAATPAGPAAAAKTPAGIPGGATASLRETLSMKSLENDRSLGAVLAYLIIAQFGVFSSVTIPAPAFTVGVAFLALFLLAALFFIHFTYSNYRTGIRHLVISVIVGFIIAVILGHFWAGIPLARLLSAEFFETSALVALVTGLALSLFMGGKG